MRENVDDDILTNQHFPWAHMTEKEFLNGLIPVGANSRLVVGGEIGQQTNGPWKHLKRGSPNPIRSPQSLDPYLHMSA